MFEIKTMNSISPMGIEVLEKRGCRVGPDVEKPQAMLIRSFSQALRGTGIDAQLIIYGSGPLGEELRKLIETEKMEERITIEAPDPQWLS